MSDDEERLQALAADIAVHGLVEFGHYEHEGLMIDQPNGPAVTLDDLVAIARLAVEWKQRCELIESEADWRVEE